MTPRQIHNRKRESLASRVDRIRRERGIVDLFEPPTPAEVRTAGEGVTAPHVASSSTSAAAARSVTPRMGGRLSRVYALIQQQPRTDQELWLMLKDDADRGLATLTTVEALRYKLREDGLVRDSGRTRRNPSGRDAVLWEVDPTGTPSPRREKRAKVEARAARGDQVIADLRAAIERAEHAHAGDPVSVTTHALKAILRGEWR